MNSISDEILVQMLQEPSSLEKGYRLLLDKYQDRIYGLVKRMVTDSDDAEDVVQNTFIKVFRNIGSFEGKSQFFTWLYRIASNESITFLQQKSRKLVSSLDASDSWEMQKMRADELVDGEEIRQKLDRAIQQLPDKQKMVFNLRYFEEMSYEEMSEILETSVGALKASYHHAVKKIEQYIQGNAD